jgi:hypothetical protein
MSRYGGSDINGWICNLFPYVKDYRTNTLTRKNPHLLMPEPDEWGNERGDPEYEISSAVLPPGLSTAPFTMITADEKMHKMQFLGGFTGVEQNEATLALRPKLGWAVRRTQFTEALGGGLPSDFKLKPPVDAMEFYRLTGELVPGGRNSYRFGEIFLPNDFANFYRQTDGIEFRDRANNRTARVRSLEEMSKAVEIEPALETGTESRSDDNDWLTVADLADGTMIELELDGHSTRPPQQLRRYSADRTLCEVLPFESFNSFLRAFIEGRGQV